MSKYSKYKQSGVGACYHLYNRGNQKQKIFLDDNDYIFYLKRLKEGIEKFNFSMICYCLMPNHIHLIVQQNDEDSPSKFISSIHTSYSMVFNKKYDKVGHLFQGRFKQKIISDDRYMKCLIAYVHLNPVKDKICKFPKEYKWSSYLEYARLSSKDCPLKKDSPLGDSGGICDHELMEGYGFKGQSFEEFIKLAGEISEIEAFDD